MQNWFNVFKTAGTWLCCLCIFLLLPLYIFAEGKMKLRSRKVSCCWDLRTDRCWVESAGESLFSSAKEAFGLFIIITNNYGSSCRIWTKRNDLHKPTSSGTKCNKAPFYKKHVSRGYGERTSDLPQFTGRVCCRDRNRIHLRSPELVR